MPSTATTTSSSSNSSSSSSPPEMELVNLSPGVNASRGTSPGVSLLQQSDTRKPVRGASLYLQMKLMLWKHLLTKVRDVKQLISFFVVPTITLLIMWLLRKRPYQLEADFMFIAFAFLLVPLAQVASLVDEKQKGLKDLMVVSGLSPFIYTISWIVSEAFAAFVLAIAMALLALATNIMTVNGPTSCVTVFLLLWLFLCASGAVAFLLSSCFSRASTATTAMFLTYVGSIIVFLVVGLQQDRKNRAPGCEDWYEEWGSVGKSYFCELTFESNACDQWRVDGAAGGEGASYAHYSYDFSSVDVEAMPDTCEELVDALGPAIVCTGSNFLRKPEKGGLCPVTCGDCTSRDLRLVKGFTDREQRYMCFLPTWALMLGFVGFEQGVAPLPIGIVLSYLCLDVVLFVVLGWYLGEVFPGEFGTRRPPWFVLLPSFWRGVYDSAKGALCGTGNNGACSQGGCCQGCACCVCCGGGCCDSSSTQKWSPVVGDDDGAARTESSSSLPADADSEAVSPPELEKAPTVQIQNLRKEFGSHVAVNSLSVDMFEGEIFALLGHNGAGKTTTVSMLTGLLDRSSGDATIYGHKLSNDIWSIRKLLGMCPQHDVLFEFLTVEEHILLFAQLKGAARADAENQAERMLSAFELLDRREYFAHGLSGGMKRKTCLAVALSGDTRLVILDEPTTGLDPGARRRVWDALGLLKSDRTIIMSTHFMDEAEVLGDRVGIMKDGELSCVGTPNELKARYKCGYELVVQLSRQNSGNSTRGWVDDDEQTSVFLSTRTEALVKFVEAQLSGAEVTPSHHVPFEVVFRLPYDQRAEYGALLERLDERMAMLGVSSYGISVAPFEEVFLKIGIESSIRREQEQAGHRQESEGAFSAGKNDESTCGWAETNRKDGEEEVASKDEADTLNMHLNFGLMDDHFYRQLGSDIGYESTFKQQTFAIFARRMALAGAALGVDFHGAKELIKEIAGRSSWFDLRLADLSRCLGLIRGIQTWLLVGVPLGGAIAAVELAAPPSTALMILGKPEDKHDPLDWELLFPNMFACMIIAASYLLLPGLLAEVLVSERESRMRNLLTIMGLQPGAFWIGHALADLCLCLVPLFGTWIALEVKEMDDFTESGNGMFFVLHTLFIFQVIAYAYAFSHFFQSAATATGYISAITFGLMIVPSFLVGIVSISDRQIHQNDPENRLQLKEVLSILILMMAGLSPPGFLLASSLFLVFPTYWREDHGDRFAGFWSNTLSPLYAFVLLSLGQTVVYAAVAYYLDVKDFRPLPPEPEPFKTPQAVIAAMDDDVRKEYELIGATDERGGDETANNEKEATAAEEEKKDVGGHEDVDEEDPMHATGDRGSREEKIRTVDESAVVYRHLRKAYPKPGGGVTLAVMDSNLHVKRGECFGLLGPNGAGKSTTVAMMTRHTPPTRGDAFVMGHSIRSDFFKASQSMGVVTQENSIYGELTARDHLVLFCRLQGVTEHRIPTLVQESLLIMELGPHAHKPAKRLSGGMKRKLCTALSLIGNPPVIMMDEPSSGLDPASRRNLWKVINETMQNRAVVLTTHLLDEAEALCSRLAIMTKGQLRCIGTPQHLRQRHGVGYQVTLTTKEMVSTAARDDMFAKVDEFVVALFGAAATDPATGDVIFEKPSAPPGKSIREGGGDNCQQRLLPQPSGAYLKNRNSRMLTYVVPLAKMKVPEAFRAFEANLERLNLDNYVISQPTLEQVFLEFTVERERRHGVSTNDQERALAEAWDDTDVRIAELSKPRCCGCERRQHRHLFYRGCPIWLGLCLLLVFGTFDINMWYLRTMKNKEPFLVVPDNEYEKYASGCNFANEPGEALEPLNGFDDGVNIGTEEASSNTYTTTQYGIIDSTDWDVCGGVVVDVALNPRWDLQDIALSLGISGDVDSRMLGNLDYDETRNENFNERKFEHFWDHIYDEVAYVYLLPNGISSFPVENFGMHGIGSYDLSLESFFYLGGCGGCQYARLKYEDDEESINTCRSEHEQKFTDTKGRCQADCASPWYATCIPQTNRKDENGDYQLEEWPEISSHLLASGNFSILVVPGGGVNIRSCDSGLRVRLQTGVHYSCNGTEAECQPLYRGDSSTGYDDDLLEAAPSSYFNATGQYCQLRRSHIMSAFDNWYSLIIFWFTFLCFCTTACFACITGCCGLTCTRTPDDSNNDIQPTRKKRFFSWGTSIPETADSGATVDARTRSTVRTRDPTADEGIGQAPSDQTAVI